MFGFLKREDRGPMVDALRRRYSNIVRPLEMQALESRRKTKKMLKDIAATWGQETARLTGSLLDSELDLARADVGNESDAVIQVHREAVATKRRLLGTQMALRQSLIHALESLRDAVRDAGEVSERTQALLGWSDAVLDEQAGA